MQQTQSPETVDAGDGAPSSRAGNGGLPVVGIGASAGGLDAFIRVLRSIPPDAGCAFVLVQHLDARHPSSLSTILGHATTMPVGEASDGMPVEPNRVFVIPPNTELTIANRVLRLSPRQQTSAAHMPVDRFLSSLARDCGSRAIGVILSGAGSDGATGLLAVREAGGVTFAQDPATAEFPSMPAMAAAGGVDFVLAPEQIAVELVRVARDPHFGIAPAAEHQRAAATVQETDGFRAIYDLMREGTGIDFARYRETTVSRRIHRRLALRNVGNIGDYAQLLAGDPDERTALQRDLLIGVTSFFREPESFLALKRLVFPVIVRDRPANSTIRIWVPGCASGEEAYSILIALQEYQSECGTACPVQIFASDISESAIDKARAGRYPESIAAVVSPERLRQHFTNVGGGYQIGKDLRERCIFSRHNLLDDPPFSNLDLISCRNVLIYLNAAHEKIIPLFHYALREPGFCLLGRAETTHSTDLFSALEPPLRIYAKRHVTRKPYGFLGRARAPHRDTDDRGSNGQPLLLARSGDADLRQQTDRILLSKYSPTGVLVDEGLEVLEIRGPTAPFLTLPTGRMSFHLLKLIADTGLFLAVEKLVQEATMTGEPARRERVAYEGGLGIEDVNIEVTPLHGKDRRAHLILFEAARAAGNDDRIARGQPLSSESAAAGRDRQIAKLKQDLEEARQQLVSLVDEHETSDLENQQITEDALSANEELQSLSEELETAKEELQSTNEELITVNRDLESRNLALASARDIAKAIVETVGVPLVVADGELTIRHVNASFTNSFQVSSGETEGRPLYIACGGAWDVPECRASLERLRRERTAFDGLEVEREFPSIGTRTLILSGRCLDPLDLLLLTIEDVTAHRKVERALRKSEENRREAEKMQAIGRLAGGVAHDFNNLLTVIIGYADVLAETLESNGEASDHVATIRRSAERAAMLTDQLLAFSRRKVLQSKVFDLNVVIVEFEGMMRRLLGEPITIVVQCASDLWRVRADPGEIGRVVMNLCLNARDAMPAGGTLTIQTGNVHLDEAAAGSCDLPAGPYVRLVVGDTGIGMDAEMRTRVFEPFFTTKETYKGAGLGLSTALGIVHLSDGAILCDSELGQGTQFTILLPVATAGADVVELATVGLAQAPSGSSEVVLLVEDEDGVRRLARKILERLGYVVLEAKNGREALSVIETHRVAVDILVSDVVMPGFGGRQLAERALALRPGLKMLFMSGHTEDAILKEGVSRGTPFLSKPFTPSELAHKVREVLDSNPGQPFEQA